MKPTSACLRGFCLAALLLAAGPARAGMLTSASLSLEMTPFPMAPLVFTAAGALGSASGPTQATLAAGSAFAGTQTTMFATTFLGVTGLSFQVGSNAHGVFTGGTPGALHGAMPIAANLCFLSYGGICFTSFFKFAVPIGTPLAIAHPPASGVAITAIGNGWTAGSSTIQLLTPTSQGLTTTRRVGSNGLDALGRGTVTLVSGINVLTNIAGQIPGFATLTLNYVPEPGTLALLGSAAALALSGGVRRRRRQS